MPTPVRYPEACTKSDGFTLVELITVMAILLLLASLLIPSVQRGIDEARNTHCMSNLRQLSAGWMAYASDHDGQLMGPGNHDPNDWLYRTNGTSVTIDSLKGGQLFPYLKSADVFRCPSDPSDFVISYTIHFILGRKHGNPVWGLIPMPYYGNIPKPSSAALMLEEHDPRYGDYPEESGFAMRLPMPNAPPMRAWWKLSDWQAWRHDQRTNLSFCDGHVESWRALDPNSPYIVEAFQPIAFDNPDFLRLISVLDNRTP